MCCEVAISFLLSAVLGILKGMHGLTVGTNLKLVPFFMTSGVSLSNKSFFFSYTRDKKNSPEIDLLTS